MFGWYDFQKFLLGVLIGVAAFQLLSSIMVWLDESDDKKEGQ